MFTRATFLNMTWHLPECTIRPNAHAFAHFGDVFVCSLVVSLLLSVLLWYSLRSVVSPLCVVWGSPGGLNAPLGGGERPLLTELKIKSTGTLFTWLPGRGTCGPFGKISQVVTMHKHIHFMCNSSSFRMNKNITILRSRVIWGVRTTGSFLYVLSSVER